MARDAAEANRLTLGGRLVARDALRHTPAGVPVATFRVAHASRQMEAGAARQVDLEIACVAVEELARAVAAVPLGTGIALQGFLAPKGRAGRSLVLHVTELEFKEKE